MPVVIVLGFGQEIPAFSGDFGSLRLSRPVAPPRARLVEIPGGGHLLNLTSPEEFRTEVLRFLQ